MKYLAVEKIIAILFTIGFFICFMLKKKLGLSDSDITTLSTLYALILTYFYGSSISSRHKDSLLMENKK